VPSGRVVRYEEEVGCRGIGVRWSAAVYAPTLQACGKPDGWVSVVNDLTELKQAETSPRESEQRLARGREGTTRLHAHSSRLLSEDDLTAALDDVLEYAYS
jgi:hypothetical protein